MITLIDTIVGGDMATPSLELSQIIARRAIFYLVGVLAVRLGKSRILSRASPLDVTWRLFWDRC